MSAVWQVCRLMYSIVPLQRWLNLGGLLIVLVCLAANGGRWAEGSYLGLVLLLIGPVMLGGFVFRLISVPRLLRLTPHGRKQVLLGVMLAVLIAATLTTAVVRLALWVDPAQHAAQFTGLWFLLGLTAVGLGWQVICFFGLGSAWGRAMAMALLLLPMLVQKLSSQFPWLQSLGGSASQLIPPLSAVAWLAFARWYVKAPIIEPLRFGAGLIAVERETSNRNPAVRYSMTRARGLRWLLWGHDPADFRISTLSRVLPGVFYLGLAFIALAAGGGLDRSRLWFLAPFAPVILALVGWGTAMRISYRGRYLWLQSGNTRAELFAICERKIWREWVILAAVFMLVILAVWSELPDAQVNAWYLIATTLVPACGMIYLGMNPAGWPWPNALLTAAIALGWVIASLQPLFTGAPTTAAWWVVLAELSGAVLLRGYSRRQWQRLDWVIHRPRRMGQVPRRTS